jgi:hypothetical protein
MPGVGTLARWAKKHPTETKALGTLALALGGVTLVYYVVNREEIEKAGGLFKSIFSPEIKGKTSGKRGAPPTSKVERGVVACPADVGKIGADISGLRKGDFVIISLASKDRLFNQHTWARVRSFSPTRDRLYVEITGELTPSGVKPLRSDKHGFFLNERIVIDSDCVFDVLENEAEFKGQVLCGPGLEVVGGSPVDTKGVSAEDHDAVQVVVASTEAQGTAWNEPLWVQVTSISPTSNVIRGIVLEKPKLTAQHGLYQFSRLQFGRDCVIDIR